MSEDTPALEPSTPFKLTTKGDSSWTTPVPWLFEAPLAAILVYLVVSGPLEVAHLVPAAGVALAMAVIALPGLAQFAPDVRAWARRTASVDEDGITVDMGVRGSRSFRWADISRIVTKPISHGMQFPQSLHLVTDFFDREGTRLPELTIHHATYRQILGTFESNPEGLSFLRALEDSPVSSTFDLATKTYLDLVVHPATVMLDGVTAETIDELSAGRLWHARKRALDDKRMADRIPNALLLLSYVLRKDAQRTAREAYLERPHDGIVRYYLAHAILADARAAAMLTDPKAIARRKRHRAEGLAMLAELRSDPVWGPRAAADLEGIEARQLARVEAREEGAVESRDGLAQRAGEAAPALGAVNERIGIFDRPVEPEKKRRKRRERRR